MTVVATPVAGFTGVVAGVRFAAGRGETDNPSALAYFRRRGYTLIDQPQPESPAPAEGVDESTAPVPEPETVAPKDPFDPSKHTVDEVNEYLSTADHAERDRVLQEETEEKARVRILRGPYSDLSQ